MCPRCRRNGLYPTGAFWVCAGCGLVITEQALHFEQDGEAPDRLQKNERTIVTAA